MDQMVYSYLFAIIAGLVLIISCFNFINLNIAVNVRGSTETGIKKVLGANRMIFARHVFTEISIFILASIIISLFILKLSLPFLKDIIDKEMALSLKDNIAVSLFIIMLSLIILLISGILPYFQKIYAW